MTDPVQIEDQVALHDQEKAKVADEAKLIGTFLRELIAEDVPEDFAQLLTRDRLGYMHDRWPEEGE